MRAWIHVDKNAMEANDRDGGRRPVLVVQDERGLIYSAQALRGPGWELQTQQSHPRPDRPHAWLEVYDGNQLDLIQDQRLEQLKQTFTGQLQEG
jgi:hypothetical protein